MTHMKDDHFFALDGVEYKEGIASNLYCPHAALISHVSKKWKLAKLGDGRSGFVNDGLSCCDVLGRNKRKNFFDLNE